MNRNLFFLATLGLLLNGCMTSVSVRKVCDNDDTKGIRYSLPATFLVGIPKSDGTIDFSTCYLPDPKNTYAIHTTSFLSKYKQDVTLSNGLLKSVGSQQHSDQIPKALIDSGSKVFADAKKAEKEAADAAAKKRTDALDAANKKIDEAEKALDSAWTAEAAAQDKLTKAENADRLTPGSGTKLEIENAKVDLVRAVENRIKAENDLAAANAAKSQATAGVPGGNIPGKQVVSDAKRPSAWGPVIYRVVHSTDGVKLVPAEFQVAGKTQIQMATSKKTTSAPVTNSAPALTLHGGNPVVQLPTDGTFGELVVDADADFMNIKVVKLMVEDGSAETREQPIITRDGRRQIHVSFDPTKIAAGRYQLEVAVLYKDDSGSLKPSQESFKIVVVAPKPAAPKP